MTTSVPPPLALAAGSALGSQPLADGALMPGRPRTAGQPVSAAVISITARGR